MSLNIKNEHVHDLAREAARRTGLSQTSVVEQALTKLLEDLDTDRVRHERIARMTAVADDFASRLTEEDRAAMTTDWLYDENGLPV